MSRTEALAQIVLIAIFAYLVLEEKEQARQNGYHRWDRSMEN